MSTKSKAAAAIIAAILFACTWLFASSARQRVEQTQRHPNGAKMSPDQLLDRFGDFREGESEGDFLRRLRSEHPEASFWDLQNHARDVRK